MHVNCLSINPVKPLHFLSTKPILNASKVKDSFVNFVDESDRDDAFISRALVSTSALETADKIAELQGYDSKVFTLLKDKKPSEIEYLYEFITQKNDSGKLRVPAEYFSYAASLPEENLRSAERVFMSKNSDGLWNYPPSYILKFSSKYDYKQTDIMSKLADCNVNAENILTIAENPCLNHDKIVNKAQELKVLFGDNLKEISFNLDNDGQNSIDVSVNKEKPEGKEVVRLSVLVDNDLNPVADRKKADNIDTFADNLYNNIEDNLCLFSMQDCLKSIKDVKEIVPQATNTQILRTMQRLTQFANYNSLKPLEKILQDNNVFSVANKCGINREFLYLTDKKKLMKLKQYNSDTNEVIFITRDDLNNEEFDKVIKMAKSEPNKLFINLEGWSDGINLFNSQDKLTEKTVKTLTAARKICSEHKDYTFNDALSHVLNDDIENRLKQEGVNFKTVRLDAPASPYVVVDQMKPVMPSKDLLKSTVEVVAEHYSNGDKTLYNGLCDKISQYYLNDANIISKQGIINKLHRVNDKINGYLEENNLNRDNLYFIKDCSYTGNVKSFEIISDMYCEQYGVPKDKIIKIYDVNDLNAYPKNSTFVLLDDVIGSGASMLGFGEYMFNAKNIDSDKHLLFCPITASKKGVDYINNFINIVGRSENDKVLNLPEMTYDYSNTADFINNGEVYKEAFGKKGHGKDGMCTAFPYMTPDNDSTLSQYLTQHFVPDADCIKEKSEKLSDMKRRIYFYDVFGYLPADFN